MELEREIGREALAAGRLDGMEASPRNQEKHVRPCDGPSGACSVTVHDASVSSRADLPMNLRAILYCKLTLRSHCTGAVPSQREVVCR